MTSIHGKKIGGETYYYLREVARVEGKPKIISQQYLGKAADIAAAMEGAAAMPERTRHRQFGDLAAVWSMCQRLGVWSSTTWSVPAGRTRPRRWAPTWRSRPPTGSWTRTRNGRSTTGGRPPPGHGSCVPGCRPARPTTAGSGTRWTR